MQNISLLSEVKYFLINYGLGDTINQVLYIESNIQKPYSIICAERNYHLIQFVLDCFVGGSSSLDEIIIYQDPIHGSPLYHKYISPINLDINSLEGGIYAIHTSPVAWNSYIDKKYIDNFNQYITPVNNNEERKVILFTERSDNYSLDIDFWQYIVDYCLENGVKVFHNKPKNKNNVYINIFNLDRCEEINLNFHDLINFIKGNIDNILIGQRSGIFDVLKFTNCKKIILYPENSPSLFECYLKDDIYSKNAKDIKLPLTKEEIKQIINL